MIIDYYAATGFAIELLARSEYHRKFNTGQYLDIEILPPILRNQVCFYLNNEGTPTGMITWAWLSGDAQTDIHATGRALTEGEWSCGDRLYFNDWITPYGNTHAVKRDIRQNVFPNEVATSLRRNPDGSVRRINRWIGCNLRKNQQRDTIPTSVEVVKSGNRYHSFSQI